MKDQFKKLLDNYPCLKDLYDKFDQRKTMAYIKYTGEGFYDHPHELFLFDLWEDCHNVFDTTLPQNISLWDRYLAHDDLDYLMYINQLNHEDSYTLEGSYMYQYHDYPPETDEGIDLIDQLEKISKFRTIPTISVKGQWK